MSSSRFRMSGVLASSSSRVAIRWPARRASAASSSVDAVEVFDSPCSSPIVFCRSQILRQAG